MRLAHRIAAGPAVALVLAAAGAVTTLGSAPAHAAVVAVPSSGDRIDVALTAMETTLTGWGQGVGAHVCTTYVEPATAETTFTVDHVPCVNFVDACGRVASAAHGSALITFYDGRASCGWASILSQPADAAAAAAPGATQQRS